MATLLSHRLLWPNFEPEPYLHIRDLERAVRLSGADAALVEQEQRVLESIVLLSDIRADELMRPRTQFVSYRPPVTLADLKARIAVERLPPGDRAGQRRGGRGHRPGRRCGGSRTAAWTCWPSR